MDPVAELESVFTNRAHDAAYLGALKENRSEQARLANERVQVRAALEASVARIRAALGGEPDEKTLQAALEADAEWRALTARDLELTSASQQTLEDAQELVRNRMIEERQAQQAVVEGRARAMDPPGRATAGTAN